MSSVRAFLAIPLPDALQNALGTLQDDLRKQLHGVRWSGRENLHLTLHFFAEVNQENLEKIKASMLSVKRCQRPFQVTVTGLGAFPSLRRARVIWLGTRPQEPLGQLYRKCRRELEAAGIETDSRPYFPHVTIGRTRRQPVNLDALGARPGEAPMGRLPVTRMILYESRLTPEGAHHNPLFEVNFDEQADETP